MLEGCSFYCSPGRAHWTRQAAESSVLYPKFPFVPTSLSTVSGTDCISSSPICICQCLYGYPSLSPSWVPGYPLPELHMPSISLLPMPLSSLPGDVHLSVSCFSQWLICYYQGSHPLLPLKLAALPYSPALPGVFCVLAPLTSPLFFFLFLLPERSVIRGSSIFSGVGTRCRTAIGVPCWSSCQLVVHLISSYRGGQSYWVC